MAAVAAVATDVARAEWAPPETGYEMLRAMQLEHYDPSTRQGLDAYAKAIAAEAMVIGIFRAGVQNGRFCITKVVKYADMIVAVRAWLGQNTNLLDIDAAALADAALAKTFPCS